MSTLHDMRLVEHEDGLWSIEPLGIPGIVPGQQMVTSYDLAPLLDEHAPALITGILGETAASTDDTHIRFLSPHGEELARRHGGTAPPGKHHRAGSGTVLISPALQQRLDELDVVSC